MLPRPLLPGEEPLIWQFLILAAHENSLEAVQSNPALAAYAETWGRIGDCGLVAQKNRQPIALVWARLFPATAKGFGWISADIPELSMAVLPEHRGQGIGGELLAQFLDAYASCFPGFSLSVRTDNTPALQLYESFGFAKVKGSERANRTGGISIVMALTY